MASLGIGTSKLKPKVAESDAEIRIKLLSDFSFYTRPNFELVTEEVNSQKKSILINFQGRDLQDFIEFRTNLVLPIDNISSQFTGIGSLSQGDSILGVSTFTANYNSTPIFKKSFLNTDIQSESGEQLLFKKINHDFSTGERISYEYDGSPIEIQSVTIPGVGTTTILPSSVYAIKSTRSFLKIASTEENAYAGIGLTFSMVGSGTTHYFSCTNANTRTLILIDGLVQSPLFRKGITLGLGTTSLGISTTIVPVSGISSVFLDDFISIDDEIMKVTLVSQATTSITVERGSMGTVATAHTGGSLVELYKGNYNIVEENIHFATPPFKGSSFSGRVFYKTKYDKNVVFDDISDQFVGIAKTFNLKSNYVNYGMSTSTVTGNAYGILSLNGMFQKPVIDYDIVANTGITTLTFSGNTEYDLPKSGKILNFSYDPGSKYQSQVAAAATVTVSAAGLITGITLRGTGGGYLTSPDVNIASTVGSGASIVALVGTGNSVGFVTGFTITNAGSGYTTTSVPNVIVDPPYGYTNLPLVYVSGSNSGQEAKVSISVGAGGSIISLDLDNIGFGYKKGDILSVSGIGTLAGSTKFTITVDNTYSDNFNFYSFGQLKRTGIGATPDGFTRVFNIVDLDTNQPIGFEVNKSDARFKIENNVLVLVNGIIQKPTIDYKIINNFLVLSEAPNQYQSLHVYIYYASDLDAIQRTVLETVKAGDIVKIKGRTSKEVDQEPRGVYRIENKNTVRTATYDGLGINPDPEAYRKLDWTKQTRDAIIANRKIYKTRKSLLTSFKPTSSIIVGISTTSTEIYVESVGLFDEDNIAESQLQVEVVKDIPRDVAQLSSIVSLGGTVSTILIENSGSGYSQLNPPEVTISRREIEEGVEFETFQKIGTSSSISYYDSHSDDNKIVSVGSSLNIRYTTNLVSFTSSSIGSSTTSLKSVSYGNSIWIVGGTEGYISTSTNLSSWNSLGISSIDNSSILNPVVPYSFTGSLNSITYSSEDTHFVGVGSFGNVFTYQVSDETQISILGNNLVKRDTNTTESINKVIVNQVYDVGENLTKTQYVAVGNSSMILTSAYSINQELLSNPPGIFWQTIHLSTLSGENLNGIVHTGISTIPFIVVGDNGLILTFPNNRLNDGSYYKITPAPTSEDLKSVVYDDNSETAIIVGTSGSIFISPKSSEFKTWTAVSSGSTTNLNDIEYFNVKDTYLIVGDNESLVNKKEKIGAAATAIVTSDGTISSIVISDGGRNYDSTSSPSVFIDPPRFEVERFKSCKLLGDYGRITGVTTTSGISTITPALKFSLLIDSGLTTSRTGISTGDYFVTYNTNVGSGVTSILSTGSTIGITTTFIDCVFRADEVNTDGISGVVTVTSNVKSVNGLTSIATTYYSYGDYSWGKIYDFDERVNPIAINAENLNGSAGLTTSPKVIRVTSIGTTIVPLEA